METFSALLAICAGNSPVPGEFLAQRPVTRSFDVFFDQRLNKRLSKQSWGWWVETLSRPLWRHRNGPSPNQWSGRGGWVNLVAPNHDKHNKMRSVFLGEIQVECPRHALGFPSGRHMCVEEYSKTENESCHNANFAVNGGTVGCQNDNQW